MKIISIELVGYRWFALSQFDRFVYTPQHKIQLLLGTNGSGKSSLMRELSPLPGVTADFKPGGRKVIVIEKDHQVYVLKSTFEKGAVHSFQMGDLELNEGGTASVQRELVNKYFGITPDIHEVMVGSTAFTEMSVAQRREWFTRMSNINFNFAIALYQYLKGKLKEIDSILKFQQSSLMAEVSKVVNQDEAIILKKEIDEMKVFIDQLLQYKNSIPFQQPQYSLNQLNQSLNNELLYHGNLAKRIKEYYDNITPDQLPSLIDVYQRQLTGLEERYKLIGHEIEERQSFMNTLEKVSHDELSNLAGESLKLVDTVNEQISRLKYFTSDIDAEECKNAIEFAHDTLFTTLMEMPVNDDRRYSKVKFDEYQQMLVKAKSDLSQVQKDLEMKSRILKDLEHLKTHQQTTCPQCQHTWVKGYDVNKAEQLQKAVKDLENHIRYLETIIAEIENKLQHIKEYFDQYRVYSRVRDQIKLLEPIWVKLDLEEMIFKDPQGVLRALQEARFDISLLYEIKKHREHLIDLQKLFQHSSKTQEMDLKQHHDYFNNLNQKYQETQIEMRQVQSRLNRLNELKKLYQDIQLSMENMKSSIQERDQHYENTLNLLRHQLLQDVLRSLQLQLSEKEQLLSRSHMQAEIIQRLKDQIDTIVIQKETLMTMVQELSPKDGLIAKSLSSFINSFVSRMNKIISQIWSYPFELLPVAGNDDEALDLDYRFEVLVNGHAPVPDIKKCSVGQQEVVNLAFKIVSMSYLNLETIYLDEFGKSMDSSHRAKAFETVTQLLANSHYQQIFMVSHYEGSYGSLKNADMVVLNPDNIVIPPGTLFNQVVEVQ